MLPEQPGRACVLGGLDGWVGALELAGTDLVRADAHPELVVAPGDRAVDAAEAGAPMVLLEGSARQEVLRAAGYDVSAYLVLPDAAHPELIIPTDHPGARRYAIARRTAAAPAWRRAVASGVARAMAARPRSIRPRSIVTVASRIGLLPFPLAAASGLLPAGSPWYLHLGTSSELAERRMAFLAFAPDADRPSWAVKVARVPGMDRAFADDRRGIDELRASAGALAGRAPEVLGQLRTGDLLLSVETAAVGDRLTEVLRRGGRRRAPVVEAIAAWLVDLAAATRVDAAALVAERAWLDADVRPAWGGEVDLDDLLDAVSGVRGCLVHSDLGTWNVISDGEGFTIIDWESTRRAGLPIWDLLYFLADACAQMARRARPADRPDYLIGLFRGEAELSPLVFRWLRRAAELAGVGPREVGAIATLGWLHRAGQGPARSGGAPAGVCFAERWLADERLGPTWSCWL